MAGKNKAINIEEQLNDFNDLNLSMRQSDSFSESEDGSPPKVKIPLSGDSDPKPVNDLSNVV